MEFLFDSRNPLFKTPVGCIEAGKTLNIRCYLKDAGESGVLFLLAEDGKEAEAYPLSFSQDQKGYREYELCLPFPRTGLFFYGFKVLSEAGETVIFKDVKNRPVIGGGSMWQLTAYQRDFSFPKAFCGQVMYQIFPDRFHKKGSCDTQAKLTPFTLHENLDEIPVFLPDEKGIIQNNDFFGGNLQGIIEKIPYLKDLGVRVLYLNPIFKAFSNHRYDTADYLQVDPLLGTNEDFKVLCHEAHEAGIRIILDGVFSHTGRDSLYFDFYNRFGSGAYHHPDSPYRSWYQFTHSPVGYNAWWGIETLPCTNELDPGFQQFIFEEVIPYWLGLGADGWRLDVADELPEEFLEKLHRAVKTVKPEALVLGEVWEDASNKISYGVRRRYFQGKSLDSVMNYVWRDKVIPFVRRELSAEDFAESVAILLEHYPKDVLNAMMNLLSTHDTPRILTVLGCDSVPHDRREQAESKLSPNQYALAENRLSAAAFLLYCLPGSVCMYYGDEIGMEGFSDPFNRGYMGNQAGNRDIFENFKKLAHLKNSHSSLRTGECLLSRAENGCFSFERIKQDERIFCMVNVSPFPKAANRTGPILYEKNTLPEGDRLTLLPYGCVALLLESQNTI